MHLCQTKTVVLDSSAETRVTYASDYNCVDLNDSSSSSEFRGVDIKKVLNESTEKFEEQSSAGDDSGFKNLNKNVQNDDTVPSSFIDNTGVRDDGYSLIPDEPDFETGIDYLSTKTFLCTDINSDDNITQDDEDEDALLIKEFSQNCMVYPCNYEENTSNCASVFSGINNEVDLLNDEGLPLFARHRPSPPPPLSRSQILIQNTNENMDHLFNYGDYINFSDLKGYAEFGFDDNDNNCTHNDKSLLENWLVDDETHLDQNDNLHSRGSDDHVSCVPFSVLNLPTSSILDRDIITSSTSLSSTLSRLVGEDQLSLVPTGSSNTINSSSTNSILNSPQINKDQITNTKDLQFDVYPTDCGVVTTFDKMPTTSTITSSTNDNALSYLDDCSAYARQRLMGASAAAAFLAASTYTAKLNMSDDTAHNQLIYPYQSMAHSMNLKSSLKQFQSNIFSNDSVKHRDPWTTPLRKLTVNLIQTYKYINEVSFLYV